MKVTHTQTFTRVGRSDVFFLNPDVLYAITTIGAGGNQSDAHVWRTALPDATPNDPTLGAKWTQHKDTGAAGDITESGVPPAALKMFVDVQDPLVDGGIVVTLTILGTLPPGQTKVKDAALSGLNNQRQKHSSNRRRVN